MSKWRKSLGALAAAGFIAALAAAPTSAHAWWDNWGNWRPPAQHFYGGYGYGHHGEHEYGHPHHGLSLIH
ncbi:MAG: hypothetical protein N2444_11245, partial [Methylocystis sp.]|nr:hypothetical protein [Methylocystis sp.]